MDRHNQMIARFTARRRRCKSSRRCWTCERLEGQPPSRTGFGPLSAPWWVSYTRLEYRGLPTYGQTVHPRSRLSIAAVTLDEPVDVAAIELRAPNGQPEGNRPMGDVAVAPIDVTFKNDGGSVASINQVSATVVESEHILSCLRQGAGGVGVAAEYALKIPRGQLFEEGVRSRFQPGSTRVDPGETQPVRCNSRPRRPGGECGCHHGGPPDLHAERWRHLETDPVVIGTTQNFIDELVAEVAGAEPGNENVGRFCPRELEKIDNVIQCWQSAC